MNTSLGFVFVKNAWLHLSMGRLAAIGFFFWISWMPWAFTFMLLLYVFLTGSYGM